MDEFDRVVLHTRKLKVGSRIHAVVPDSEPDSRFITIDHALPSKIGGLMYVYSFYGKRKKMLFQRLCSQLEMGIYIQDFKNKKL